MPGSHFSGRDLLKMPLRRSSAHSPTPDRARTAGDDESTPLSRSGIRRLLVYADTRGRTGRSGQEGAWGIGSGYCVVLFRILQMDFAEFYECELRRNSKRRSSQNPPSTHFVYKGKEGGSGGSRLLAASTLLLRSWPRGWGRSPGRGRSHPDTLAHPRRCCSLGRSVYPCTACYV